MVYVILSDGRLEQQFGFIHGDSYELSFDTLEEGFDWVRRRGDRLKVYTVLPCVYMED
jgi:hypothetical protein